MRRNKFVKDFLALYFMKLHQKGLSHQQIPYSNPQTRCFVCIGVVDVHIEISSLGEGVAFLPVSSIIFV